MALVTAGEDTDQGDAEVDDLVGLLIGVRLVAALVRDGVGDTPTLAVTGLSGTVTDASGADLSNAVTASFAGLAVDTTPPDLTVSGTSAVARRAGGARRVAW